MVGESSEQGVLVTARYYRMWVDSFSRSKKLTSRDFLLFNSSSSSVSLTVEMAFTSEPRSSLVSGVSRSTMKANSLWLRPGTPQYSRRYSLEEQRSPKRYLERLKFLSWNSPFSLSRCWRVSWTWPSVLVLMLLMEVLMGSGTLFSMPFSRWRRSAMHSLVMRQWKAFLQVDQSSKLLGMRLFSLFFTSSPYLCLRIEWMNWGAEDSFLTMSARPNRCWRGCEEQGLGREAPCSFSSSLSCSKIQLFMSRASSFEYSKEDSVLGLTIFLGSMPIISETRLAYSSSYSSFFRLSSSSLRCWAWELSRAFLSRVVWCLSSLRLRQSFQVSSSSLPTPEKLRLQEWVQELGYFSRLIARRSSRWIIQAGLLLSSMILICSLIAEEVRTGNCSRARGGFGVSPKIALLYFSILRLEEACSTSITSTTEALSLSRLCAVIAVAVLGGAGRTGASRLGTPVLGRPPSRSITLWVLRSRALARKKVRESFSLVGGWGGGRMTWTWRSSSQLRLWICCLRRVFHSLLSLEGLVINEVLLGWAMVQADYLYLQESTQGSSSLFKSLSLIRVRVEAFSSTISSSSSPITSIPSDSSLFAITYIRNWLFIATPTLPPRFFTYSLNVCLPMLFEASSTITFLSFTTMSLHSIRLIMFIEQSSGSTLLEYPSTPTRLLPFQVRKPDQEGSLSSFLQSPFSFSASLTSSLASPPRSLLRISSSRPDYPVLTGFFQFLGSLSPARTSLRMSWMLSSGWLGWGGQGSPSGLKKGCSQQQGCWGQQGGMQGLTWYMWLGYTWQPMGGCIMLGLRLGSMAQWGALLRCLSWLESVWNIFWEWERSLPFMSTSSSRSTVTSARLSPSRSFRLLSSCLTLIAFFTLSKVKRKQDRLWEFVFLRMYSAETGLNFSTTGLMTSISTVAEVMGGKPMKRMGTWRPCFSNSQLLLTTQARREGSEKNILKPWGLPNRWEISSARSKAVVASETCLNLMKANLGNISISSTIPQQAISWAIQPLSQCSGTPPNHSSLTRMLQGFCPTTFSGLVLGRLGGLCWGRQLGQGCRARGGYPWQGIGMGPGAGQPMLGGWQTLDTLLRSLSYLTFIFQLGYCCWRRWMTSRAKASLPLMVTKAQQKRSNLPRVLSPLMILGGGIFT